MIRPGFVNAHTHLYSALAPYGMPAPAQPPADFVQILEKVWWRLDRALDLRALDAAARVYVAEALLAGTTALVDHHESPGCIEGSLDVLADACQSLGMRAVLTYGATERNGGRDEARRGLAECDRFLRENRRPLVRGMVGLHASFTVSDDTVREAGELCRRHGVPLHVHVAEDAADVRDARTRGHEGPLERLLELDALPAGSLLAHGVFLSGDQVRRAEALGLWLVHNPRSNANNRVGFARSLAASSRVALGTDGFPADMRAELAALARIAATEQPGLGDSVLQGRLEAGRALVAQRFGADALVEDRVTLGPAMDGDQLAVTHVDVGGRAVVENGRLLTGELGALRAEAREHAPGLWRRMEALP